MISRHSLVLQLCAGLFVGLIVLPFTAPFRACDTGTPISKPWSQDLKASDDLSNSNALAALAPATVPAPSTSVVVWCRAMRDGAARPHTLQLVLRL